MTDGGDQFPNRAVQQRSALPVQFPVVPIPSKARDGHFGFAAVCGISVALHPPSSSRRPRYLFSRLGHVFCEGHEKCVWLFAPGSVLTVVWCKAGAYRVTGQDFCSGNG